MTTFGLSEKQQALITNILSHYPEIEQAVIYGSRAKGNFREGSDIDLTLKGKMLNQDILSKVWLELDDSYTPYLFDLSIYHQLTNVDLIESINQTGKLFYQK